jgi:hypothetical protein
MSEQVGQVVLSSLERLQITLREIQGKPHVELRVVSHDAPATVEYLGDRNVVRLPTDALPMLLGMLSHTQDRLIKRGTLYIPPPPEAAVMENGLPVKLRLDNGPGRRDSRKHPRVAVDLNIECRILDAKSFWPSRPLAGAVKNLSLGGAEIWLPRRVSLGTQVEITMALGGGLFRGRAEVVGIDLPPTRRPPTDQYRHSLRWIAVDGPAQTVLTQLVASADRQRHAPDPAKA